MSERTLLLGIDTSSEGDLALAELHPDGTLTSRGRQQFSGRHQATELLSKLRLLLSEAGATLNDLRAIVVVSGPGTFTGLRIGISAAKGLAEAAAIPLIAISSLAALSGQVQSETATVLKAGRAEYYVRVEAHDGGPAVESLETDESVGELTRGKAVVIADETLTDKFPEAAAVSVQQTGAWQAILAALPRVHAGDFEDIATLDANYVRRPYTEVVKTTS